VDIIVQLAPVEHRKPLEIAKKLINVFGITTIADKTG
jgi:hypothetical protein